MSGGQSLRTPAPRAMKELFVCTYVHRGRGLSLFLEKPSDALQRIPNLKRCKMLHQTCFTVSTSLPVKSTPVAVSESF